MDVILLSVQAAATFFAILTTSAFFAYREVISPSSLLKSIHQTIMHALF